MRLPAIGPLLVTGILLGPAVLDIVDVKTVEPIFKPLISVLVALILFEGGLTLNAPRWPAVARIMQGLLTIGVMVSWIGAALLVMLLFNLPLDQALLAGSLVVVTGPTVIRPLLRRIHLNPPLPEILQWEAVLIDPMGVFLALLCFDWLVTSGTGWFHLVGFISRFSIGLVMGMAGGVMMSRILKAHWLDDHMVNMLIIAGMLLLYSLCETAAAESGLLAVVVMGLVISIQAGERMRRLVYFKRQIIPLLIALLFVLLAANLNLAHMAALGWTGVVAVLGMMLVVRPASVFLGTLTAQGLGWRERVILAWLAPKGIVAASMSSLLAMELEKTYPHLGRFLEAFTYSCIIGTILVQGATAGWLARRLGVGQDGPGCWLIVGGNRFAREVADILQRCGNRVILVDQSQKRIQKARKKGMTAIHSDIFNLRLLDEPSLVNVEQVLCLTENDMLNQLACRHLLPLVGCNHVYRLTTTQETALPIQCASACKPCDSFGVPIWPGLGHIRLHMRALNQGRSRMILDRVDEQPLPGKSQVLFHVRNGITHIVAKSSDPGVFREGRVVVLMDDRTPQTSAEIAPK
jgi:NhaP-type Na+/H+ or K+/H+ antiporter